MALETLQTLEIVEAMVNFLTRRRPHEDISDQVDLGYRFEGQSVFIFEIRLWWKEPSVSNEYDGAKATFVK